jgi:aspartate-semialdehyde dehydrogenase
MKIPVGVLGATGIVGQHYLQLLSDHPWFEIAFLAASEKSAGKTYQEAVQGKWFSKHPIPDHLKNLPVHSISAIEKAKEKVVFVFSALDNESAKIYEERYAEAGLPVVSNASAHRNDSDVPVLIPEINADHLEIISTQQRKRGWKSGFIVVKPNCSLQSYLSPIHALHLHYPVKRVLVTTMQAVSGAGHPGVSSLDIFDNIFPLPGEEEKSEKEPLKILGSVSGGQIRPIESIVFSAQCNRVPVLEGHYACISLEFHHSPPTQQDILNSWKNYRPLHALELPSAPPRPIVYREEADRPQPRLDRDAEGGMATIVGRLQPCPALHYKFIWLSHNTMRGAAGGGILNAELLVSKKFFKR